MLNKQSFSSVEIRRCMLRWTKCWEGKSPTYVKNLGNKWKKFTKSFQQKIRGIICAGGGLIRSLTSIVSRAV
jgi:hypothetical protein